ncbi:hypothetical protein BMS3Bbin02_01923 [bacterium BMS3Bbin02]|nr:hypothetical protein BMS3Bbin02_01923 [bacterium BMS3Bbin02]
MRDGLDPDEVLFLIALAGIVTGVLTKRALGTGLTRHNLTLHDPFGSRRHEQVGRLSFHDINGCAAQGAGDVVLAFVKTEECAATEEQGRIAPGDIRHRHRDAGFLVVTKIDLTVLGLDHVDAQFLALTDHRAIRAQVQTSRFHVAGDEIPGGTEVASTVARVEPRRRDLQNVGIVAEENVLLGGARLDNSRRHRLAVDAVHPFLGQVHQTCFLGHLKCQRQTFPGRHRTREDTMPGIVLDVLKQQRGTPTLALLVELGDVAELEVPVDLSFYPVKLVLFLKSVNERS